MAHNYDFGRTCIINVFKQRLCMSSAIDFDLGSMRGNPRPSEWRTGQKERLLPEVQPDFTDYRQQRAYDANNADLPDDMPRCCGILMKNPLGRTIEFWSAMTSLVCFVLTIIFLGIGFSYKEHDRYPKKAEIRMSREVLLYTNKTSVTQAMRHLHSEYHDYCKSLNYGMDLQVPSWDPDNIKKFDNQSLSTGLALSVNVHDSTISLFLIALPIYFFSFAFQLTRYLTYCTETNRDGVYKPWLGPDFSRWMEYLFTSPFQIFIVSSAFGFASRDTLLAQCGMQAALVLLGYDIEQQVKKIYKRPVENSPTEETTSVNSRNSNTLRRTNALRASTDKDVNIYAELAPRRCHHILWTFVKWRATRDIRIWVYMGVTWILHILIWTSIIGRFFVQDDHSRNCESNTDFKIPDVVLAIMWSQFILFTTFGVVNLWQVVWATPRSQTEQRSTWNFYSLCYSVLSVTAKTVLEAMFLWYVSDYETWPLAKDSRVIEGLMIAPAGQQCWAAQYTS